MMSHPEAQARLRQILQERLERTFEDPDDAMEWLTDVTDDERAEALIAGNGAPLNAGEVEELCAPLALDRELFSCIVNPTSLEVRRHSLEEVAYRLDDEDDEDGEIYALLERLEGLDDLDEEGIDELILDIAAHIDVLPDDDDDGDGIPISAEEYLVVMGMRALPPEGRERIMEFVEQEKSRLQIDPGPLGGVWERLAATSRDILALLASTPKRCLTEHEIAEALAVTVDDIAVAEQDILRCCVRFMEDTSESLAELPLNKGCEAGALFYRIGSASAVAVRILAGREAGPDRPPASPDDT